MLKLEIIPVPSGLIAISNAVRSCGDFHEQLLLGDVVISVETAARQAKERGHSLLDELRILLVFSSYPVCKVWW